MSHIFISHAEHDGPVVWDLGTGLENAGYKVWFYERDSLPGATYLSQVANALRDSRAVVVVVSPESVKSDQVTNELVRAFEDHKPLIPVLHNMTHEEFRNGRDEWRQCFGASTSVTIPEDGVAGVVPRIAQGLELLGIKPGESPKPGERKPEPAPKPVAKPTPRPPIPTVSAKLFGAVAVSAVVVIFVGLVVLFQLNGKLKTAYDKLGALEFEEWTARVHVKLADEADPKESDVRVTVRPPEVDFAAEGIGAKGRLLTVRRLSVRKPAEKNLPTLYVSYPGYHDMPVDLSWVAKACTYDLTRHVVDVREVVALPKLPKEATSEGYNPYGTGGTPSAGDSL